MRHRVLTCAIVLVSLATVSRGTEVIDLADGADVVIHGPQQRDFFAGDFSIGPRAADLDADGWPDVVLSDPFWEGPDCRSGAMHVLFGPLGPGTVDLATPPSDSLTIVTPCGTGPSWYSDAPLGDLPSTFEVGDLNGDGIADLAIGYIQADGPGDARPEAGEVRVLFGPLARGFRDLETQPADLVIFGGHGAPSASQIDGGISGDCLGAQVVIGDITGDGVPDLLLGAPGEDGPDGLRPGSGAVHVFNGPLAAGTIDLLTAASDETVYGPSDRLVFQDDVRGHFLGTGVAVVDVTGDTLPDLIVGEPESDGPRDDRESCGALHVFPGPLGPGVIDLDQDASFATIYGKYASDEFGQWIMTGDVSGDGLADIAWANKLAMEPSGRSCGRGVVLFSPVTPGITDLLFQQPDIFLRGATCTDMATTSDLLDEVAVSDIDGDGKGDLLVGVQGADGPDGTRPDAGAAYVFRGPIPWGTTLDFADLSRQPDMEILGARGGTPGTFTGDRLGIIVGLDVTGDGSPELVTGSLGARGPAGDRVSAGSVSIVEVTYDHRQQQQVMQGCLGATADQRDVPLIFVRRAPLGVELAWAPATIDSGDVTYDSVRGEIGSLSPWSLGRTACIGEGSELTALDIAPRGGLWYLVRARSSCGTGSFGDAFGPRDAGDSLDGQNPCP